MLFRSRHILAERRADARHAADALPRRTRQRVGDAQGEQTDKRQRQNHGSDDALHRILLFILLLFFIVHPIDGREARTFASQGQQRSAVLSLKLTQLEWAGQESGEAPILMLDDVMSELDPNRRRQLIERIDRVQTFVTCTDLSDLAGAKQGAVYRVEKGELKRI